MLLVPAAVAYGDPGEWLPRGTPADLAGLEPAGAVARMSVHGAGECRVLPSFVLGFRDVCAARPAPAPLADRLDAMAGRATLRLRDHDDPEALHAVALADLLAQPASDSTIGSAIATLGTAARLSPHPAAVLADLSYAHLLRAGRTNSTRDRVAALDAAERALRHDPRNAAALFNRALALRSLNLPEQAARGWSAYLAAHRDGEWARRAVAYRAQAVAAARGAAPAPADDAPVAAFSAFATFDPQQGRTRGFCHTLDRWAAAVLAGDAPAGAAHLERAAALGDAVARRPRGDASLADAVGAIRATPAARLPRLARAHAAFAEGCRLLQVPDFKLARARFLAAAAGADASPVLRAWARMRQGDAEFHAGQDDHGVLLLRETVRNADPSRHGALAASARLALAAQRQREQLFKESLDWELEAARLATIAGERETEGAAWDGAARVYVALRETGEADAAWARALERLAPYRDSYRLHNLLAQLAETAAASGYPFAALRIQEEGVAVARRTGQPAYEVEALQYLAGLRPGVGQAELIRRDFARVDSLSDRFRDNSAVHAWMRAQRLRIEAESGLFADPAREATAFDSADSILKQARAPLVALQAAVGSARAWLKTGDTAVAMRRIEAALALFEARRDSAGMPSRRAAAFEAAREMVDRAVLLRLAGGDPAGALAMLDRGRTSLAPVGRPASGARPAVEAPPGEIAVAYALIADTLLAWTVEGRRVAVARTVVDTASLVRTIESVLRRMESGAGEGELRDGLAQLHEWLLGPLRGRLGRKDTPLVILAEGDVGSIPFAALLDRRTGRYLAQDHPLRSATTLAEARRPAPVSPPGRAALFVADPAFDTAVHPDFKRLAHAAREVAEIAPGYAPNRVLAGAGADSAALLRALPGARLLHYAGHAVYDDERPEDSYLLLAPTPGTSGAGVLHAREIAGRDLRGLRLVVLAACRTVRTGPGRAAGFSGLAGAFLAAGAGGAVGSLWEVEDDVTRDLMLQFHRAYRATGNGPEALRTAQTALLASNDPRLRSPSAWAAFRYAGR